MTRLRALLSALADALLACGHPRLGLKVTRRGERYFRTCLSCARLVAIPLADLSEIKPPRLTADTDQEWLAAREQLALGGTALAHQTGLERFADRQETETPSQVLERMVGL